MVDPGLKKEGTPQQTRMLLLRLKKPVPLPTCLLDAIKDGGIESISAFEEDVPPTEEKPCE